MRVKNYKDLENAIGELKKEAPQWLVIDVIDYLYDICRTYVLDKNNVEDEGDIPYRGYKMVRQFFWGVITKISNLCDNIIFISHEDVTTEKNKFGREITNYVPKFESKMLTQMTGIMTVVGRCLKETSEKNDSAYVLRIGHNDNEIGGTRFKLKETQIPQGLNTLTVVATNINDETQEKKQDIKGVLPPTIKVARSGNDLVIILSDEEGITEFIHKQNGKEKKVKGDNKKEIKYRYKLADGHNLVEITVTNVEGATSEFKGQCEK